MAPPVAVHDTPSGTVLPSDCVPTAVKSSRVPAVTVDEAGVTTTAESEVGGGTTITTEVSFGGLGSFLRRPVILKVPVVDEENVPSANIRPPVAVHSTEVTKLSDCPVTYALNTAV